MGKFRVVTHVIFDMDGLLLDTERLYTIATQAVTSEFGKDYPYDLKEKCMGKTELAANQLLIDALGLPLTVDEFISKLKKHFEELFPTSELMPGAEKLVRHLSAHKIPIAIATGSNKWKYDLKTQNHKELFDLFHHKVLIGDDPEVHHGKPQPDCFLVSASRFPEKPSPDKVLVFEDSGNGVMAAHGAGMQCVWVPDPQTTTAHLATKATQIIPSLQDFRPEDYGLPPFNNS